MSPWKRSDKQKEQFAFGAYCSFLIGGRCMARPPPGNHPDTILNK
nr:MAG TPA: hypothetical protein [Caudoviricetes sp.]